MGVQTGTCQKSAVGCSRKCKVGNVCAELGDHNYSANIEDHDILNGSNSSCILGVYNYLSEFHDKINCVNYYLVEKNERRPMYINFNSR